MINLFWQSINGKRILFDYRHLKKTESGEGPEINLKETLKKELKDAGKQHFHTVRVQKPFPDSPFHDGGEGQSADVGNVHALAGDDVEKMKKMQTAMQKGFKQATGAWGKDLPDICQKTLDAANQKFEDYYKSKESTTKTEG